jgi:ubiquinone/menaquinone biosynthesis C-methylase UbiE
MQERVDLWDSIARDEEGKWKAGKGYHHRLKEFFQYLIPPGARVLELGYGQGDLLAALKPARGVGVDFSKEMVARAKVHHPECEFIHADVHEMNLTEEFD